MSWGARVEIVRRERILLSVAAYSYEMASHSIMSDQEFDKLALSVFKNKDVDTTLDVTDPKQKARYIKLDKFFATRFDPYTGQWIYNHPELDRIVCLYNTYYIGKQNGQELASSENKEEA